MRNRGINGTHMVERTHKINQFAFKGSGQTATAKRATFTKKEYLLYNIPMDGITGNKPFHTGTLTVDFPNGQFIYMP